MNINETIAALQRENEELKTIRDTLIARDEPQQSRLLRISDLEAEVEALVKENEELIAERSQQASQGYELGIATLAGLHRDLMNRFADVTTQLATYRGAENIVDQSAELTARMDEYIKRHSDKC